MKYSWLLRVLWFQFQCGWLLLVLWFELRTGSLFWVSGEFYDLSFRSLFFASDLIWVSAQLPTITRSVQPLVWIRRIQNTLAIQMQWKVTVRLKRIAQHKNKKQKRHMISSLTSSKKLLGWKQILSHLSKEGERPQLESRRRQLVQKLSAYTNLVHRIPAPTKPRKTSLGQST